MNEEPIPVTKTRRWRIVAFFDVADTPDPAYDVSAHEDLADELQTRVENALGSLLLLSHIEKLVVEEVMVEGD